MAKTFTYYAKNINMWPGFNCFAAIINNQPNAILEIKRIRLIPLSPTSASVSAGANAFLGATIFNRITSLPTGGYEKQITPVKFDTNSASLPSQVVVYENYNSLTTSTGQIRKKFLFNNMRSLLNGIFGWGYHLPGGRFNSRDGCRETVFISNKGSTVESIVIREGQGLAIASLPGVYVGQRTNIDIIVTNASSGATYLYSANPYYSIENNSTQGELVTLFNTSGSGVTLNVKVITHTVQGEGLVNSNLNMPYLRLAYIDGLSHEVTSNNIVSPISNDTNNTLPSLIKLYQGPLNVRGYGSRFGVADGETSAGLTGDTVSNILKRGVMGWRQSMPVNTIPTLADSTSQKYFFNDAFELFNAKNSTGFILKNGEGFGLLNNRDTLTETYVNNGLICDIEIVFTYAQYGTISKNRVIGNV